MEDELLGTIKAAERAEVAESTIRHAIKTNKLKAKKIGRDWQIRPDDLEAWRVNRKMGRPRKT